RSMGRKEKALGVSEDATDEQIDRAGEQRELGAHIMAETGTNDPAAARGKVASWKEQAAETQQLRAELLRLAHVCETGELASYLPGTIGKKITPAQAWAKDSDGMPVAGTPAERWTKMGLAEAKAFIAESPDLALTVEGDGKKPKAVEGDTSSLDAHEIAW